ncbi:MAG: restriction endonuclease subunit S [Gemmatimonadota bacterium]
MAGEWRTGRLGDVADINPDAINDAWPYAHIRYVDISSVGEGMLTEPPQVISLAEAPSRAKRLVREEDTVLSTVRPNRRSMFFVYNAKPDLVVSTGFAVLRPKPGFIHPRYLYACVFDRAFTDYLVSREKGAAYPAVLPEDIADATITLPPLSEQRAIAHILGTLDDKIELNRRMSETLEAMARAIFKAWFVDFEPVRAKMEGRWRRGESLPGLPAHLYDLFPDRLVDSELGQIPDGWPARPLKDVLTETNDRVGEADIPEYSSTNVGLQLRAERFKKRLSASTSKNKLIHQGDLVFGLSRQVLNFGLMRDAVGCVSPVYRVFSVNKEAIMPDLLERMMRTRSGYYYNAISGSSREGQSISAEALGQLRFVQPATAVQNEFYCVTEPLCIRANLLQSESRTLAALRDTLLPKLISGELRVKDAEKFLKKRGL